jgi:LysR family transcriptional regulator, low CO2-responsive transcriptional regulator
MTLAQLRSFVTVARLGSVKAAARELAVSEPAVSEAVAGLRRELGDRLYVRNGHGVALTAGGRRLAQMAAEILGLADQARRELGGDDGVAPVRVAATSAVAEYVATPLIDAFAVKSPNLEIALEREPGSAFAELLDHRRADLTLGPRPSRDAAASIRSVPILRCVLMIVAEPGHRLSAQRDIAPPALAGERWLVGPGGIEPSAPTARFFEEHGIAPEDVRAYSSEAAVLSAAASGDGIALTVAHAVLDQLRRRALVRLRVRGTPIGELWHASTLADRCLPAAAALQRFATTPEATQAMSSGRGGVPAARFRPPVHVTLWSSVARRVDAGSARPLHEGGAA